MTVEAGRLCQDTIFCIMTEGKEGLLKKKKCVAIQIVLQAGEAR